MPLNKDVSTGRTVEMVKVYKKDNHLYFFNEDK